MSDTASAAADSRGESRQGGLITFFARNRVAGNLLMVVLLGGGLYTIPRLPVENVPEMESRRISVVVPYPGALPGEVEESITRRIEENVLVIGGVDRVTTTATESLGKVVIDVRPFADVSRVLDDIRTAVEAHRKVSTPRRGTTGGHAVQGGREPDDRGGRLVGALGERLAAGRGAGPGRPVGPALGVDGEAVRYQGTGDQHRGRRGGPQGAPPHHSGRRPPDSPNPHSTCRRANCVPGLAASYFERIPSGCGERTSRTSCCLPTRMAPSCGCAMWPR